jgi:hypothetical protein
MFNVMIERCNSFILASEFSFFQFKLVNLSIFSLDISSKSRHFILYSLYDFFFVFLVILLHFIEFSFDHLENGGEVTVKKVYDFTLQLFTKDFVNIRLKRAYC